MTGSRRLAAVMFTDLVDYTALSQRDEAGMLAVLSEHRSIVRPAIAQFGGREVKTTGDGFLVEFGSALDATLCAAEIQSRSQRWRQEAHGERPYVRIAVHVGDVVHEGDDILGDAVNIAARLEPLAEPGGICVSGAVYEQVVNKVTHKFERLPTPALKGVSSPLEAYRLIRAGAEIGPSHRTPAANRIAVMPLASISPDPNDAYLADGLTDELITALSQPGGLSVIARSSVDQYRRHAKSLPQVGLELNVQSVIEGSVRRVGNTIRVSIQLIDVPSQAHIWTRQYDRELDDVLSIQSDIARQVAENLRVTVPTRPGARISVPLVVNTGSYLTYLKGRTLLRQLTLASANEARSQFEEAVRLDPRNARAFAGLADASYQRTLLSGAPFAEVLATLTSCKQLIAQSLALDPDAAEARVSLGHFHDELFEFGPAEQELRAALALNPSLATAHRWFARLHTEKGRLLEALEELRIAEEADPLSPDIQSILARTLLALDRPEEATAKIHRLAQLEPDGMRWHYARFEQALRADDRPQLLREVEWFSEQDPNGSPAERRAYWTGIYHAVSGDRARALEAIATLLRVRDSGDGTLFEWTDEQVAEIYADLGDRDECFRHLDRALASRALSLELWWTRSSLEGIRQDPRFRNFLARVMLP
ncbi:MAG: adenylate/guanylate cyclase domain-containing protein [Thermoplasmata archaeon]